MAALQLREGFQDDPAAAGAYAALIDAVFEIDLVARDALYGRDPTSVALGLFDGDGACVAGAEVFTLGLRLDGMPAPAAAIRLVAVAEAWRGQGLFRRLMPHVLARCEAAAPMTLLYAEHPGLYQPFGFRPVGQHKVVGPVQASAPRPSAAPRRLDPSRPDDLALLKRLLSEREPVSERVAVEGAASLFLSQAGESALAYSPALDAVAALQVEGDVLTLVDVVAAGMPTLAALLAALHRTPRTVEVLFPTDKLAWHGAAVRDDTGLMLRGPAPAAFRQPFMLPPTTGF